MSKRCPYCNGKGWYGLVANDEPEPDLPPWPEGKPMPLAERWRRENAVVERVECPECGGTGKKSDKG